MEDIKEPQLSMNIGTLNIMLVWGQLVEAYHNVSPDGKDVTVVYAYQLAVHPPSFAVLREDKSGAVAGKDLAELCRYAEDKFDAAVSMDGLDTADWLKANPNGFYKCAISVAQE